MRRTVDITHAPRGRVDAVRIVPQAELRRSRRAPGAGGRVPRRVRRVPVVYVPVRPRGQILLFEELRVAVGESDIRSARVQMGRRERDAGPQVYVVVALRDVVVE